MTRITKICILFGAVLVLLPPVRAQADAAPPWTAQGATVETGQTPTYVQMLREEVLVIIEPQPLLEDDVWITAQTMVGHVEAEFTMRNHGAGTEAFDVWFPLMSGDEWGDYGKAENFRAWVDGAAVEVEEALGRDLQGWRDEVPWARWPVTFPPDQETTLRVTYDIYPLGYFPWGEFIYILETGAGWYETIGAGSITFQLPYAANELNADLPKVMTAYAGPDSGFDQVKAEGTKVTWTFSNLEPEARHDLKLDLLAPSVWENIQAARQAAEAQPDSAQAQLQLAEAYGAGIETRKGWIVSQSASRNLFEEAVAAYQRAISLAPEDVEVLIAYLNWLSEFEYEQDLIREKMLEISPQAEPLFPYHPVVEYARAYLGATATPTPTKPLTATDTPRPTATPTPTQFSTATSTPRFTATPAPSPSPTSRPTATPVSNARGGCPGALALALLASVTIRFGQCRGTKAQGRKASSVSG